MEQPRPEDFGLVRKKVSAPPSPEDFGLTRRVAPGEGPQRPLDQSALGIGERLAVQNLASDDAAAAKWLQARGYEVGAARDGRLAVKDKDTGKWGVVDESGPSLSDVGDIGNEVINIAGGTLGGIATGAGTFGAGAVGGVAAGSALSEAARKVAAKAAGFEQSAGGVLKDIAIEGALGATFEVGGHLISKGLGSAAKRVKDAYRGATTFTRGEIQQAARKVPASDLGAYAGSVGVKWKPGMTADEVAEAVYQRQRGAAGWDAENAVRAGEFIDKQSPNRFDAQGRYGYRPNDPSELNKLGQVAQDQKEAFKAKVFSKTSGRAKEMEAIYGQPPQMPLEEWEKVPYNQLREIALNDKEFATKQLGKSPARATKNELAKYADEFQPGATDKAWDPEYTRAQDVTGARSGGKATRTVFDAKTPPYKGGDTGWRQISLRKTQRLESASQGVLDFENVTPLAKALRQLTGKVAPLKISRLAEAVGRASKVVDYPAGKVRAFARNNPAVAIAAGLASPQATIGIGALDVSARGLKGISGFLAGDPGPILSKVLFDPSASPTTKSLAQKVIAVAEKNPKKAKLLMQALLRSSPAALAARSLPPAQE